VPAGRRRHCVAVSGALPHLMMRQRRSWLLVTCRMWFRGSGGRTRALLWEIAQARKKRKAWWLAFVLLRPTKLWSGRRHWPVGHLTNLGFCESKRSGASATSTMARVSLALLLFFFLKHQRLAGECLKARLAITWEARPDRRACCRPSWLG
jgi:hypothetical protein